jgi:hypothetical protein
MKWQPIDSAPKNKEILIYGFNGPIKDITIAEYNDNPRVMGWDCVKTGDVYHPTHWIPLPKPPKRGKLNEL